MDKRFEYECKDPECRACVYRPPEYSAYIDEYSQNFRQSRRSQINLDYSDNNVDSRLKVDDADSKSAEKVDMQPRSSSLAVGSRHIRPRGTNALDFRSLYFSAAKPYQRLSIPHKNVKVVEIDEQYVEDYQNPKGEENRAKSKESVVNRQTEEEDNTIKPYVDTIVSYKNTRDLRSGNLRIENIVKIGENVITRQWDCRLDQEINQQNNDSQKYNVRGRDNFTSRTMNTLNKNTTNALRNSLTRYDHQECELCFKDKDVFIDDVPDQSSSISKSNTRK